MTVYRDVVSVMEVRSFAESDRAELRALSVRAGEGSPTASLWGHPESEQSIYLDPYMDLAPDTLFLAVRDGALVGYLTGCPDGTKLPGESELIDAAIRKHRLMRRPVARAFFARAMFDSAASALRRRPTAGEFHDGRWPAHLHINVAPEARGTGAADALMNRWLDHLRAAGSPGCHLQTLVENPRAVRFFARMGFTEHGAAPLVPGLRYEGRKVHQRTMVRAL
ncbi:GNAT family N-acetyltransferase [Streptomyces sp. NPDC051561]|uniref:GNAT family N-acetyltransferase n=1 Tax=Streptomyces sp. NPDC051561 TaxID=3365658 RepID=UPI0037B22729